LWGIALKNNVTVDELKEWNNLSADLILVNQELAIGESAEEQASVPEVQTPAQALEPAAETETEVEEEPAVEVPAATEVEVQETEEAEAVEVEAEEEPVEAESEEEVEEEAPAADTVADTYTVQPGDTIGGVASEFGMSYRTLMSLNGITDHLIFPGQELNVNPDAVVEQEEEAPAEDNADAEAEAEEQAAEDAEEQAEAEREAKEEAAEEQREAEEAEAERQAEKEAAQLEAEQEAA